MQRFGIPLFIAALIILITTVASRRAVVIIQVLEEGNFIAPIQGALV